MSAHGRGHMGVGLNSCPRWFLCWLGGGKKATARGTCRSEVSSLPWQNPGGLNAPGNHGALGQPPMARAHRQGVQGVQPTRWLQLTVRLWGWEPPPARAHRLGGRGV